MEGRGGGRRVRQGGGEGVEINALWINGLATVAGIDEGLGRDASGLRAFEQSARASFLQRFVQPSGCADVVDPDNMQLRPNCLLALSLPHGPLLDPDVVRAIAPALLTSVGLRSLAPSAPAHLA